MFIGVFVLIFFNATLFNNSESILIILAVYAAAAYKLLPGINQIIVNLQQIKLYEPAINVVYDHSKFKNFTKINLKESKLIPFKEEIEIKNLTFGYNEKLTILEKANFKIKRKICRHIWRFRCRKKYSNGFNLWSAEKFYW